MRIIFTKMNGAGNDFVMISKSDLVCNEIPKDIIKKICDRKLGVGADGLIIVSKIGQAADQAKMTYYNSDGSFANMCGNGLRCASYFATKYMGLTENLTIHTDAGLLRTMKAGDLSIKIEIPYLKEFSKIELAEYSDIYYGNTGVPHAVVYLDDIKNINVKKSGALLRAHTIFGNNGTNVNFVRIVGDNIIEVRTYERGVEDETSACGTGIAASAICSYTYKKIKSPIEVKTIGGDVLSIEIPEDNTPFRNVYLTGPVAESFKGILNIYT